MANNIDKKALRDKARLTLWGLADTVTLPTTQHDLSLSDMRTNRSGLFNSFVFELAVNGEDNSILYESVKCPGCGKLIGIEWDIDINEIKLDEGDVHCEGAFDTVEFEIEIPTGEIICTDWIRDSKDAFNLNEWISVNSNLGKKKTIEAHAEAHNMHHVFVGNTCPQVYLSGDSTITVESPEYNEHDDEEIPSIVGAKNIDSICTDLWWATIIDKSIALNILTEELGEDKAKSVLYEYPIAESKVKPGVYKCTYFGYEDGESWVYSKLVWDREIS